MSLPAAARIASTKGSDFQYRIITAALRQAPCACGDVDCMPFIKRGTLARFGAVQAPSTTLLAMAKRGFVVLDRRDARIVGGYVTALGRRWQRREAEMMAWAERTARIMAGC